jgi:hypothetical protein
MAAVGLPPATPLIEPLRRYLGPFQGVARLGPSRASGSAPLTQGGEDVQAVLQLGPLLLTTSGSHQFNPLAQTRAAVADHGRQGRPPLQLGGPSDAVAGLGLASREPAEAGRLDRPQDRLTPEKISSAVACVTREWAASSRTSSNRPARRPAAAVARRERRHAPRLRRQEDLEDAAGDREADRSSGVDGSGVEPRRTGMVRR